MDHKAMYALAEAHQLKRWQAYCMAAEITYCENSDDHPLQKDFVGRVVYNPYDWLDHHSYASWTSVDAAIAAGIIHGRYKASTD